MTDTTIPLSRFLARRVQELNADAAQAAGLFGDLGNRIALAKRGIFSIDTTAHRAKRLDQARSESRIEYAYRVTGIDRRAEYAKIAGDIAPRSGGIWPQSTGEYADRCRALDKTVLAQAQEEVQ